MNPDAKLNSGGEVKLELLPHEDGKHQRQTERHTKTLSILRGRIEHTNLDGEEETVKKGLFIRAVD